MRPELINVLSGLGISLNSISNIFYKSLEDLPMRYINLLLIIALSLFTLSFAQESDHSHNSDNHHASEQSTEESSDHHTTDEHSSEHNEHIKEGHHTEEHSSEHGTEEHHEHSSDHDNMTETKETSHEHSNDEHSNDEHSSDTSHNHDDNQDWSATLPSANKIMFGEKTLRLYPLLSPEGDFQIMVQSDKAGYTMSVKHEDTSLATTFDEAGLTHVDLGMAKHGNYHLTFRDGTNEITVPVSVYQASTLTGKTFTVIFAPSPSLSSQGLSEVFVYNVDNGENQHETISMNYRMQGMQHSSDQLITPLEHEHFEGLKSALSASENAENTVLESAMSNRSAVSFSMVGSWQFTIIVDGETLGFNVAMSDQ